MQPLFHRWHQTRFDLEMRWHNIVNQSQRTYDEDAFVAQSGKPLDEFRRFWPKAISIYRPSCRNRSGHFEYLGYDMVRHIEHLPNINSDPIGVPDALFLRPSVVAVDGQRGADYWFSVWHSDDVSARAACAQAAERIGDAMQDLERPVSEARDLGQADEVAPPQSNFTKEGYVQAVEKARITSAQVIFSGCSSPALDTGFSPTAFALYRSLRRTTHRLLCSFSISVGFR